MMHHSIFVVTLPFLLFLSLSAHAQEVGCTDMHAINYSSSATENDGSCVYPATSYRPELVNKLDEEIEETSGLIFWNGKLWTINDSGNLPILYELDSQGIVTRRVWVEDVVNIDWEALSQSDTEIFIGDIGNNNGNRTDLSILKIKKSDVLEKDTVSAEQVFFSYPEQTDFSTAVNHTAYDCEAFFYASDSFYLFTKNWIDTSSTLYVVPNINGSQEALLRSSFPVGVLITDASYDSEKDCVFLIGYSFESSVNINSYMYLLFDYRDQDFFSGNKRKIKLGSVINRAQTEGVVITNDYQGYFTGEKIVSSSLGVNVSARLHRFDLSAYFYPPTRIFDIENEDLFQIYPNPAYNEIYISFVEKDSFNYSIFDIQGRKQMEGVCRDRKIDISFLSEGHYLLQIEKDWILPFVKGK